MRGQGLSWESAGKRTAILASMVLVAVTGSAGQSEAGGLTLEVTSNKATYAVGETPLLTFTFRNTTGAPVSISRHPWNVVKARVRRRGSTEAGSKQLKAFKLELSFRTNPAPPVWSDTLVTLGPGDESSMVYNLIAADTVSLFPSKFPDVLPSDGVELRTFRFHRGSWESYAIPMIGPGTYEMKFKYKYVGKAFEGPTAKQLGVSGSTVTSVPLELLVE